MEVGGPFDTRIIWKRPSEFLNSVVEKIEVFSKTVDPTDMKEGSLGDSWFISSVASLAEMP